MNSAGFKEMPLASGTLVRGSGNGVGQIIPIDMIRYIALLIKVVVLKNNTESPKLKHG